MSADLLRRAAAQIREDVAEATPGPWEVGGNEVWHQEGTDSSLFVADTTFVRGRIGGMKRHAADARHIARFGNPLVALAVADWVEAAAFGWDALDQRDRHALAVARAYLGESS